jgi:hypothetical protein
MRSNYIAGVALALLLVSQSAVAKESGTTFGVQAGTLGVGVGLTSHLSEEFSLRGGVNSLKFDFDTSLGGVDYNMEPDFKNVSLLLDYHPFSGAFRLTGGLYWVDHTVAVVGTVPRDAVPSEYSQYAYLTDRVGLQGSVDYNSIAPYAGLGWSSWHGKSGWGISCDFGLLFQGGATVSSLDVVTDVNYDAYQREVDVFLDEQEKEIQDELDKYEIYPVAAVHLYYSF